MNLKEFYQRTKENDVTFWVLIIALFSLVLDSGVLITGMFSKEVFTIFTKEKIVMQIVLSIGIILVLMLVDYFNQKKMLEEDEGVERENTFIFRNRKYLSIVGVMFLLSIVQFFIRVMPGESDLSYSIIIGIASYALILFGIFVYDRRKLRGDE